MNITKKTQSIIEDSGLYIEKTTRTLELKNGTEIEYEAIEICEESSDFLIIYGIGKDGILFFVLAPDYIEDLPAHITNSMQLRNVAKYIAKRNDELNARYVKIRDLVLGENHE